MGFVAPVLLAAGSGGIPLGGFAAASSIGGALSTVGTVFSVVSTVAGIASGVAGAQAQSAAQQQTFNNQAQVSEYNAQIASNNAAQARQAADIEANELRVDARRKSSAIRARQAASGVVTSVGSPLLVSSEQLEEGGRASEKRLYSGELEASGFESQARLDTFQGRIATSNAATAKTAGKINTTTSLIKGAGTLATVGTNILG
jgi:hypothetical protein